MRSESSHPSAGGSDPFYPYEQEVLCAIGTLHYKGWDAGKYESDSGVTCAETYQSVLPNGTNPISP